MLKFLKKKDENTPPDVGQEEEGEYKEDTDNASDNPDYSSYEEVSEKPVARKKRTNKNFKSFPQSASQPIQQSFSEGISNLELEKINARLELVSSMIKSFNERFSLINQQIGEIRTMSVTNEKNLSLSNLDAKKVIELVKEVNPEKLRVDYRRMDFKVSTLAEKLESNKQFVDSVMEELKDLKRKANLFEGTDALLKLNEDVKKDLIEIQKTNSRVRMNADKSEQIFIELNKGFQENQKINQMIVNLDDSYSGIKKEIEKLNLDYKQILNVNDFNDFKKMIEGKFAILENALADIDNLKSENDKFSKVIEKILFMEKRNEEDIANLGLSKGDTDTKKIEDYEQKLFSILGLMDKMALEINKIKERIGLKPVVSAKKSLTPENIGEAGNVESPFEDDWEEKNEIIPKQHVSHLINKDNENQPENPPENPPENLPEENSKDGDRIIGLLLDGTNFLAKNDLPSAIKIYEEVSDLYNPAEDDNNSTYPKIIEFYGHLSAAINKSVFPVNYSNQPANSLQIEARQYKKLNDF